MSAEKRQNLKGAPVLVFYLEHDIAISDRYLPEECCEMPGDYGLSVRTRPPSHLLAAIVNDERSVLFVPGFLSKEDSLPHRLAVMIQRMVEYIKYDRQSALIMDIETVP